MGQVEVEIWLPVDPLIFGLFLGICLLFVVYWLWKLAVSIITGA